jgi:hypothetical protein
MPKVNFRMASASRESVLGVQTSTARKNHRSGHTEGRLTTTPSGSRVTELVYRQQLRPVIQDGAEAMDSILPSTGEPA